MKILKNTVSCFNKGKQEINKILFYIDCMGLGGAQRVMKNLIDHYSASGKTVVLVTDYLPEIGKDEYEISVNIKRIFLQDKDDQNRLKNINRIKKLRQIIKELKPDLAVSFLGPPNIRLLIATLGLKTRKVVSVRNDPNKEYGLGLKKIVANLLFCIADGIVFQTQEAAEYFNIIVRKKSSIIYNPVDPVFYQHEWKNNSNEIVSIGRLQEQKNPELLLHAFLKVADSIPEYSLGFYGEGELMHKLKEITMAADKTDRVLFHGASNNIPVVLEKSALFVMSSDYEGMPNALMEAMAVGVPIIATDCPCGGPKELVQRGQGILVPCRDEESMSQAIIDLLKNEPLKMQYGAMAKERAKQFTPEIILEQWDKKLLC